MNLICVHEIGQIDMQVFKINYIIFLRNNIKNNLFLLINTKDNMGNQTSSDNRRYGWKRDHPDCRDHRMFYNTNNIENINNVDLRNKCPKVYDQGDLGSCTANAIAFAYQFDEFRQNEIEPFMPSRLFIYYNERKMEGDVSNDSGAAIRDGIKSINVQGVCPESEWPYNIDDFTDEPSEQCYEDAKNYYSVEYNRVDQVIPQLKACLNDGFPFVFGFSVYESFESPEVAETGVMPIPKKNEKLLGGHAVAAVGYDNSKKSFIIRNSWGEKWGLNGYFYMPYEYISNCSLCNDFWVVKRVKNLTVNDFLENKKSYKEEQDSNKRSSFTQTTTEEIPKTSAPKPVTVRKPIKPQVSSTSSDQKPLAKTSTKPPLAPKHIVKTVPKSVHKPIAKPATKPVTKPVPVVEPEINDEDMLHTDPFSFSDQEESNEKSVKPVKPVIPKEFQSFD